MRDTGVKRVVQFLGLERSIVGLLSMAVLVGMGERMAERFLPIYIVALGGGALSVGLLNGLQNLLNALCSYPGGYLAERTGAKRSLLVFNGIAMTGFLMVILIPRWEAVILGGPVLPLLERHIASRNHGPQGTSPGRPHPRHKGGTPCTQGIGPSWTLALLCARMTWMLAPSIRLRLASQRDLGRLESGS